MSINWFAVIVELTRYSNVPVICIILMFGLSNFHFPWNCVSIAILLYRSFTCSSSQIVLFSHIFNKFVRLLQTKCMKITAYAPLNEFIVLFTINDRSYRPSYGSTQQMVLHELFPF